MKQIIKALLESQKEMGSAKKGSTNPFFKSKYADLNAIREAVIPVLNNNDIVALQPTVHVDGKNFVKTILMHVSGESIEGLTEIIFAKTNDAQAHGGGITYARRYGLQSLVNIGADDDDGTLANEKPEPTKPDITEWLTDDNLKIALTLDAVGINATLSKFDGNNGKGMKKDFRTQLTNKLKELTA